MSKYLLIAVAFLATNNLKAGDRLFSSAVAPVTPARLDRPAEITPTRPGSRGCLAVLFRRSAQVSPVARDGGDTPLTRHPSPVPLSREEMLSDMVAFEAWREECELGTPILSDIPEPK